MVLVISPEILQRYIKEGQVVRCHTCNLQIGDKVIISVGTYCGEVTNDDWRWIEGYVARKLPLKRILPRPNEEVTIDYYILDLVPEMPLQQLPKKLDFLERMTLGLGIHLKSMHREGLVIDTAKNDSVCPSYSGMIYQYVT